MSESFLGEVKEFRYVQLKTVRMRHESVELSLEGLKNVVKYIAHTIDRVDELKRGHDLAKSRKQKFKVFLLETIVLLCVIRTCSLRFNMFLCVRVRKHKGYYVRAKIAFER